MKVVGDRVIGTIRPSFPHLPTPNDASHALRRPREQKDKNDAVIVQDDGVVSSTADIKYTENTMAISTVTPHIEREIEAMASLCMPLRFTLSCD